MTVALKPEVQKCSLSPFSCPPIASQGRPRRSRHRGVMGRRSSSVTGSYFSQSDADHIEFVDLTAAADLDWPFGRIDSIDHNELRETAYELFFMSCRSSPGFGGRSPLTYYTSSSENGSWGEGASTNAGATGRGGPQAGGLVGTSRIKRVLGLKARRSSQRASVLSSQSSNPFSASSGPNSPGRFRRPLTSAEIMRQQMRVTEQSDHRLRKTLMRTLVGQIGRRAETIILPLELLRQLKPSEFASFGEYHHWQKRQLKILEAGLLLYPSVPLEPSNSAVPRLREVIRSGDVKAIDMGKNSEAARALCTSVVDLAWRSNNESCHWMDGHPLNVHIYVVLLQSIFDLREETVVLDEVDELVELMKKTWATLGISRVIHNVCFTWVIFQQYVKTGQGEQDLLCATLSMLVEIGNDARRAERDEVCWKVLTAALASMQGWGERRLMDYHDSFGNAAGAPSLLENVLLLALASAKIVEGDLGGWVGTEERGNAGVNQVDYYIRCSLRSAFGKVAEENQSGGDADADSLIQLAQETEELALDERARFTPTLKKYHDVAAGVAAVTLHNCYGSVLRQYLSCVMTLTHDSVRVLQAAGKLEKVLAQMVVEDSVECGDGEKGIVREMMPYEVETIIVGLVRTWIEERLTLGRECLDRAKDMETWNPRTKTETHAQSSVELMNVAKQTVDDFFQIPVALQEDLVQELADGLELLIRDYTSFASSCGSKQSYIPTLPALTRCNRGSRLRRIWRKASPCKAGTDASPSTAATPNHNHNHPRPSTSRATQRLYVRLNTLHYLLYNLHHLDRFLSNHGPPPTASALDDRASSSTPSRTPRTRTPRLPHSTHRFDVARSSIHSAIQHVAEVAAFRLIFLDSNHSFYEGLYCRDVANARIRPVLRIMKQNLILLLTFLAERAQPVAMRKVMKASFEAFLMVLLAGGSDRAFARADTDMVAEDFHGLKRVFAKCGEGLMGEDVVEREAEVVEGVLSLMRQSTEQLVEDFSIVACEASGLRGIGGAQSLPMPPTTGRWNRTDPNTILRVLCHRDDEASDRFLKKTFQLARRT